MTLLALFVPFYLFVAYGLSAVTDARTKLDVTCCILWPLTLVWAGVIALLFRERL